VSSCAWQLLRTLFRTPQGAGSLRIFDKPACIRAKHSRTSGQNHLRKWRTSAVATASPCARAWSSPTHRVQTHEAVHSCAHLLLTHRNQRLHCPWLTMGALSALPRQCQLHDQALCPTVHSQVHGKDRHCHCCLFTVIAPAWSAGRVVVVRVWIPRLFAARNAEQIVSASIVFCAMTSHRPSVRRAADQGLAPPQTRGSL